MGLGDKFFDFRDKKVLLVMHYGSLGGAERQGLSLSKTLTEDYNCSVYLLLTFSAEMQDDFETYSKECHIREIFHTREPYLYIKKEISFKNFKRAVWTFKYLWEYRKLLELYKFDIIVPFLNFPSKVAFYLYKMLPTVRFTFWHQLGLDTFKSDLMEKYAAKHVPLVIANSSTGLRLFREHHKLEPERAYTLPQFLAMEYECDDNENLILREKYDLKPDDMVFGMVAHYREDKMHYTVLEAFKKIALKYPNAKLIFAGNRESSPATREKFDILQKLITDKGFSNQVLLLSQVPIKKVLNLLNVGILISQIEGLPNAVMEYMLYSLPVIATNHPGCVELLGDSEFLIPNDADVLATKMEELISNPSLRDEMAEKNRKFISGYTRDSYVVKLANIINEVKS